MSSLQATWRHPSFRLGMAEMAHLAPGLAAWGLVSGVAMVESGLSVPMSVFMTLVVFAGSAQLAALPLIASSAPVWLVWATAACVNLRFVIFSAQWRPYLRPYSRRLRTTVAYLTGDMSFVMFMRRYPKPEPSPEQLTYLWGSISVNWISWQLSSLLGIFLADRIPSEWGLGFAGILVLLGMTCSLLTDRATWTAAGVAACAAVAAYALPLKLHIVVAIAAAVAAGLLMEPRGAAGAKSVGGKGA